MGPYQFVILLDAVEIRIPKNDLPAYWEDWFGGIDDALGVWSSENNGFRTSISPV